MNIIDKIPDGIYYSRFPHQCPKDRNGRADKDGKWQTPVGIVIIKSDYKPEGK